MKKIVIIVCFMMIYSGILTGNILAVELQSLDIHGFVSQGYMQSDKNNFLAETEDGTFQFNELGINFSTDLNEKLRLGIQFFARDIGDIGNNDINIDWAFADYRWKDWLGLRVGKIKIPLGFYNETRDIDIVRTNILLPQSVYPEIYRDNVIAIQGIGIYGNIPMNAAGDISYQFQYGTMDIDDESGSAKLIESSGFFDVKGFDMDQLYTGSLKWESPFGLQLGGSLLYAKTNIDVSNNIPFGTSPYEIPAGTPMRIETDAYVSSILSAEYVWKNLTLSSEYALTSSETQTTMDSYIIFPETKTETEGYYIGASYRVTDWFEVGGYYSEYYPNKDDKDGENEDPDYSAWSKDTTLTTRFDINERWILKLEGHFINGTATLLPIENPDGADKNWFLFGAKMTFSF